jgi:hypothetical protein
MDSRVVRHPSQFGGLDAVLRTHDHFSITYSEDTTFELTLQVSRNLHQYFAADSSILKLKSNQSLYGIRSPEVGNRISISVGAAFPPSFNAEFAIQRSDTGRLIIRNADGFWETPGGSRAPIGAIFLRPLDGQRLELVVWGTDLSMAQQAARLVPMMTGTGQPDFIILREEARWKGADKAWLGWFDEWWRVTRSSVLG